MKAMDDIEEGRDPIKAMDDQEGWDFMKAMDSQGRMESYEGHGKDSSLNK